VLIALEILLKIVIVLTSLFMIGLVLIQRGKGGGLAGAFGAAGGSSAFGTKSGDVFTRITIYTGLAWVCMAMLLVVVSNATRGTGGSAFGNAAAAQRRADESRSKPIVPRSGEGTEARNPDAEKSATTSVAPPATPAPVGAGFAPERPAGAETPKP
jgi:preprotein translocase subunit SecG